MEIIRKVVNAIRGPLSGPQTLQEVLSIVAQQKKGKTVDMTDNKGDGSAGGAFVDFGWYDEHRFNRGWLRYAEMTVFSQNGQDYAIGIGKAGGGYTMNGIDSDLRMMPLPTHEDAKKHNSRIRLAFREEGHWTSSLFTAEDNDPGRHGRLYHRPVDHFDTGYPAHEAEYQGRWAQLLTPETLTRRLPEGHKVEMNYRYGDSKIIIEPPGRAERADAQYNRTVADALALVIEDLLAAQKKQ